MSENSDRSPNYIGVEVGETGVRAVCVSQRDEILEKTLISSDAGPDILVEFVKSCSEKHGAAKGAGIATVPGSQTEAARVSNDLLRLIEVKPILASASFTGIYGELHLGAGRGCSDVFYATLGNPVQGALALGGEVWSGSKGLPCEFGSLIIDSEGRSVAEFVSDESILRRTRSRFNQDQTSSLNSLDEGSITVGDIIAEALKGDDFALMMLERTGRFAGRAIAAVINLLNVQKVIIGGPIVRDGSMVIEGVKAGAEECSAPASFSTVEIVPAELGSFSAAVGAALFAKGK